MKLLIRALLIIVLLVGFSPIEYRIASANLGKIEILTDSESHQLTEILAGDIVERLDSLMDKFSLQYRFSGNILVAMGGQEVYSRAVGYADPLKKEPLKTDDVFQLASVSKQFTAAAIMLLKSDGRLDFNDPLVKYLPELPYTNITLDHLLHHVSGMPNYMYLIDKYWKAPYAPDNEDVVDLMAQYKLPLFFAPGTRYNYSNTGYVMLATVVERITGLSLNEFLQRRLFKPLGMKNTYVYSFADSCCPRQQIDGFRALRSGYVRIKCSDHDGPVGDKGICSTVEDLLKWDQALYKGSPINQSLLDYAFTPYTTTTGRLVPYGLGFRIREAKDSKVVYHNGIWEGSRINFHRFIETGNTIIVLNNTSTRANHELVNRIENILSQGKDINITAKITRLVIDEGIDQALDYFYETQETEPFIHADIRKLMQAAEYMHSIGQDNKGEEIRELCRCMVSK